MHGPQPGNVNTKTYWDGRFSTGDWERHDGRSQTEHFARGIVGRLRIPRTFAGTLLDFGCGLGDAIPVYREAFPRARLMGIDISEAAVERCRVRYGSVAQFLTGDAFTVPQVDVIISSNVFEHLSNPEEVAKVLLSKCRDVYIITPYKERLSIPRGEHVNFFTRKSFAELGVVATQVYACLGWSEYGFQLLYNVYLKNLLRPLLGRPLRCRSKQILFHICAWR